MASVWRTAAEPWREELRARARDVTAAVSKEPQERDDAHVSPLLCCECSDVVLVRVVPCVH